MVTSTRKFDRGLSTLLLDVLHWLNVPGIGVLRLNLALCLHGQARYLVDHLVQPLKLLFVYVCVPPTDTSSSYLAVDSTPMAVGLFRSLVRRSGTLFPMYSDIRNVAMTAINSFSRQYFSVYTTVTSAIEVSFETECTI